jgi:hypothetical protein
MKDKKEILKQIDFMEKVNHEEPEEWERDVNDVIITLLKEDAELIPKKEEKIEVNEWIAASDEDVRKEVENDGKDRCDMWAYGEYLERDLGNKLREGIELSIIFDFEKAVLFNYPKGKEKYRKLKVK